MTVCDDVQAAQPNSLAAHRPLRILHVLGGLDPGGIETWLLHVLRSIDRSQFQFDFVVHTSKRCAYDEEVRALGSHIFYCPSPSNPLKYGLNFQNIVQQHGPYDVVHSHVHHFSGWVLAVAKVAGVRGRIAHSHNDTAAVDRSGSSLRRLYLRSSEWLIHNLASTKLAASRVAAGSLFGPKWASDPKTSLLYYGLDFGAFRSPVSRHEVRSALGLAPDDFVVGHVGRFVPQKNHEFLLRLHKEMLQREPKAMLLLVGKGPLESEIRQQAEALGIAERIRFAGVRSDIPQVMKGAMDVFILPSLYEGLGLVVLEAQAAGLLTFVSDGVPVEADLGCGLLQVIPLSNSVAQWVDQVCGSFSFSQTGHVSNAILALEGSEFEIGRSVSGLTAQYRLTAGRR